MDAERGIGCFGVVGVVCGAGANGVCGKGRSVRSVVVMGSGEFRVWGCGPDGGSSGRGLVPSGNRERLWSVEFQRHIQGHAVAGTTAVPGTFAGDVEHCRQWV